MILRPKLRGVNSVSGLKLHDFEIICPAGEVHLHPATPCVWAYGPDNLKDSRFSVKSPFKASLLK